jgi:uncharacterized membrane protein
LVEHITRGVTPKGEKMNKTLNVQGLVKVALVAAIYVAITLVLKPISFGAVQFRIGEMLMLLAFYNRRYIGALTIGVMIANFFGDMGITDSVVGGFQTFAFLSLGVILFDKFKTTKVFGGATNLAFILFSFLFAASMFIIALELVYFFQLPFWITFVTTALGELVVLLVGSFIVPMIARAVDLEN